MILINEIDMGPKLIKNNTLNSNNLNDYYLESKKINNLFIKFLIIKLIRNNFTCNINK